MKSLFKTTIPATFFFILAICINAYAQTNPLPKTIIGGVLNGKATSLPKPEYPIDARAARLSGQVKVQVLIDESGKVVSANAISGLENVSLRIAAEAAAMSATFSPTLLSGQPVKVSGVIAYNFVAEQSNEEKLKVMGVSAFLSIARAFTSDMATFKEVFEGEDMFKETTAEFPEFAKELTTLTSLEKLTIEKRNEAIDNAANSIKARLNGPELWQFEVGKRLGNTLSPFMLLMASDDRDLSKIDQSAIKMNLRGMKDLIYSAPADFPKDVLDTLKIVVAASEKDDLLTQENVEEFFKQMADLLETISPGSTK